MMGGVQIASLAYRTDLALLRLGGSEITDHGDHLVVRTPANPSYWWGNCLILDHAPADARPWVAAFEAEFPASEHLAIGVDGAHLSGMDLMPFAEAGLTVERAVAMTATAVHSPPRPHATALLRRFVGDNDWAARVELSCSVNEDHSDASYRSFATAKALTDRRLVEQTGGDWFGAFIDDQLVAQLGLVPITDDGARLARFQSVETHPGYRNQGLAGTLVEYAGRIGLTEYAAETLVMVADPDYVACRVYRSVGFTPTESVWEVTRGT